MTIDNVHKTYLSAALAVVLVAALLALEGAMILKEPSRCGYVMISSTAVTLTSNKN